MYMRPTSGGLRGRTDVFWSGLFAESEVPCRGFHWVSFTSSPGTASESARPVTETGLVPCSRPMGKLAETEARRAVVRTRWCV